MSRSAFTCDLTWTLVALVPSREANQSHLSKLNIFLQLSSSQSAVFNPGTIQCMMNAHELNRWQSRPGICPDSGFTQHRTIAPAKVAPLIVFLAADASELVTGVSNNTRASAKYTYGKGNFAVSGKFRFCQPLQHLP